VFPLDILDDGSSIALSCECSVETVHYIVMAFGALLAITGVVVFVKMGVSGESSIKMFGFEFKLGGSALVIFVLGCLIFLAPLLNLKTREQTGRTHNDPPPERPAPPRQRETKDQELTGGGDSGPHETQVTPLQNATAERVRTIVAEQLGFKVKEIAVSSRIAEDLKADSLDFVELVMAIEEAFRIEIRDEEAEKLKTVSDLIRHVQAKRP
jgi:acyl carrier protein